MIDMAAEEERHQELMRMTLDSMGSMTDSMMGDADHYDCPGNMGMMGGN